ncbi:hypothetical protein D3C75_343120 [compost metagenome]
MSNRPFTWQRLLVEVILLLIIGGVIDAVARAVGIDTNTVQWFVAKLILFMAALYTFLPAIVDKILDTVDSLMK